MNILEGLTIWVKPQGKQRPRFNPKTKTAFTPKKTKEFETAVAHAVAFELQARGIKKPSEMPVLVDVRTCFKAPKSRKDLWKKIEAGDKPPHLAKPDGDNILKAVCDALNGLAYLDDKQVFCCRIEKHWGSADCLEIYVSESVL